MISSSLLDRLAKEDGVITNLPISKSDFRVLEAIQATQDWLDEHEDMPNVDENFNFTIAGCERRNLKEYKQMLGKNKAKLSGRLRELYQAI